MHSGKEIRTRRVREYKAITGEIYHTSQGPQNREPNRALKTNRGGFTQSIGILLFYSLQLRFNYFSTMAARRVAKTSINWTAFAETVPKSETANFQMLKAKNDTYLRR